MKASRFVANKGLQPILTGIFLQAENEPQPRLVVRAGNGQSLFQAVVECQSVEESGHTVAPAQLLVSIVKSLESGAVELSLAGETLWLKQPNAEFSVATIAAESFPDVLTSTAGDTEAVELLFPTEAFTGAIERIAFAASKDESKPVLTSVFIELTQPNAVVTSDGFRLYREQVDLSLDRPESLLFPARLLKELLVIAKKRDTQVLKCTWYPSLGQVVFQFADTAVQGSLVNGDFPPYRNIIPDTTGFQLDLDRELLSQRIQQVMVMARELSSIVVFEVVDGQLVITSQAGVRGRSTATLTPSKQAGTIPKFACNGAYVLEFLNSIDDEVIQIQGTDSLKPLLWMSEKYPSLLYLVMPFKLQE